MDEMKIAAMRGGVGAGGAAIYGLTLNEWVAIVTIVYFVVQIVILTLKFIATIKGWVRGN